MNSHEDKFEMMPINLLVYSGRNPRQEMRGIEEFAENIKQYGIIEPITVRPKEGKFEIVVGERRVKAAIIAGIKEIPARVRVIDDRVADELRLIENIHRDDLTGPEKGDAVYGLLQNYPDKYPTLASVAQGLNMPYKTFEHWRRQSSKLSAFVKESLIYRGLDELQAAALIKYDHPTQDRLARAIMDNTLNQSQSQAFLKLYDADPKANLEDLAVEAKGIKKVTVSLHELSEPARMEVEQIIATKKEEAKEIAIKSLQKATQAPRRPKVKKEAEAPTLPTFEEVTVREEPTITQTEIAERLAKGVQEQIKEAVSKAPEKVERITDIIDEEIRGLQKRLEIFPEKSQKIQPKFDKFEVLVERGVIPYTVWSFQYRDDYAGDKEFHGNCSPQIVEQCIWRLTEEGDLVVDPMAGSGTALDVCREFNRRCIGYDIKPPSNREDIIQNDSRSIPLDSDSVAMIFIHPPYWNLTYFTKAEEKLPDLSRASTPRQFLEMLEDVFRECYRVLKPGKYMCVLLGDLIREGRFIPLCRRATNLAEEIGFIDCGYAIKLAHGEVSRKKSGVIVAEPLYTDNLKISHDLVMFFRK